MSSMQALNLTILHQGIMDHVSSQLHVTKTIYSQEVSEAREIWNAEGKYSKAKGVTDLNTQGGLHPLFASEVE